MTTTMFAKEVGSNFNDVLTKLADGYEIKVLSEENSPIAMITPLSSEETKGKRDLFGFAGILKGMDLPTDKKELRRIYHERLLGWYKRISWLYYYKKHQRFWKKQSKSNFAEWFFKFDSGLILFQKLL